MHVIFLIMSIFCGSLFAQELLKLKAIDLLESGNYTEAIQYLEQMKKTSQDKELHFLLGLSYHKMGEHNKAVQEFLVFDKTNPNNKEYHYYLAVSLFELQKYEPAINEFRKSELLGIRIEESNYYSGYIYFIAKDYPKAFNHFVKAIKENGPLIFHSRYYAGVCLYNEGPEDLQKLDGALYHFQKALDAPDKNIVEESRRYIDIINEYITSGISRKKSKWQLNAKADMGIVSNRMIQPVEGAQSVGFATNDYSFKGDIDFKAMFSPLMYDQWAIYLMYGFAADLAFKSELISSNTQKHQIGFVINYFSPLRIWEAGFEYHYSAIFMDQDKLRNLTGGHVIKLNFDKSFSKKWTAGVKIPFYIYSGNVSGISIGFALSSIFIFSNSSIKIEPSITSFSCSSDETLSAKFYEALLLYNTPIKLWVFQPSIEVTPGFMSSPALSGPVYKMEGSMNAPLGLGMKLKLATRLKHGYIAGGGNELFGYFGFEYVF